MTEKDIRNYSLVIIRQILQRQIRYNYGFGVTKRYNGDIVEGDYRDVVDTGEFMRGMVVEVDQDISLNVYFTADRSEEILDQHPELTGIIMEEILDELADALAYVAVKAKLTGSGVGRVRVRF